MKITKEIMEQYELIRCSGVCNMLDYYCVIGTAIKMRCKKLSMLTREDYKDLLLNFCKYMKQFDIKQE